MSTLASLIDQGIKAFTRGQRAEAERCWREALALDPGNQRVQGYLRQLAPARPGGAPAAAAAPAGKRPAATAARESAAGKAAAPAPPRGSEPAGPGAPGATEYAPSPWDDGPAAQAAIVIEPEGGLDFSVISEKSDLRPLVPEPAMTPVPRPAGPRSDVDVWMQGARELFALGDFSGSLEMIEKILKIDPGHTEARAYLKQNESTLVSMYESKLGSVANVPRLAIKPEEVMWLNLDHRAGFLLAQIDGSLTFEELFALSGLPRLDTAKILAQLLTDGVIRGGA